MVNTMQDTGSAATLFASMNAASGSSAKTSAVAETQNRFLKLLITQMKNQDPLNPMDNAQVTSQMAQLSTVTGIDKLNATLQALSDNMTSNQSLQAASMIGRGVLVDGRNVELSGAIGYGGFELMQPVDNARVSIYDQAGVLVRNIELGAQPAGIAKWAWDGRDNNGTVLTDGSYRFSVDAVQGKDSVAANGLQFGMVNSVTQTSRGVMLSIGKLPDVALSQVRQIL